MNDKVHALINQQINKEFYSAYLYLNFSNYFEEVGLDGFANWYKIQAQEERDHAMLFYQYLQNENQKVTLEAIDKPDLNAVCHMDVLKAGLEHEKYVTSLINDIYGEAYEARDFRTMQFLDWFVKEQGEEETNANDLISKMELFGSDSKSCICSIRNWQHEFTLLLLSFFNRYRREANTVHLYASLSLAEARKNIRKR